MSGIYVFNFYEVLTDVDVDDLVTFLTFLKPSTSVIMVGGSAKDFDVYDE